MGSYTMIKKFRLESSGYEVEIGKVATQADGAVWLTHGGTVILATAVSSPSKDFPGFLPLSVDYREQFAAAGKIPGGYFKREGKSSDQEVLTSRLIDRTIRPLFPENYFHQLQVLPTVYSSDKKYSPRVAGLVASSLALSISKIPFLGPVGAVEVGRVDGTWVINPNYEDSQRSDVTIIVAGTQEGICMVEGCTNEITEKEFLDALFMAHDEIKVQVAWQNDIVKELGAQKEDVSGDYHWDLWTKKSQDFLTADRLQGAFLADKVERGESLSALKDAFMELCAQEIEEKEENSSVVKYIFDAELKKAVTEEIFNKQHRVDARAFDQVREITGEVGILPCTHGSALFNRGRTQALVSVTLGGGQDEQRIESIMNDEEKLSFMLHYNFPPFSVGEARPLRGPGRREVGHGYLAKSALKHMMPTKEEFPYTLRVVADMLGSDGSTSMATTCGTTLGLMHAGVPIKKMVSGIAMGLLMSKDGKTQVLSDITGFEDAYGMMDFKVTGTDDGITAIQMDIKYKGGLSREVFENALAQARHGRLHIMGEMRKVMTKPNEELSNLVPKVTQVKIATDKIGVIIGPGGKMIREIIDKTGTTIDIEEDGTVKIFAVPEADLQGAISWVKTLAGQIEKGMVFQGKIRRIVDFGLFVELVPGQDGLLHISAIPRDKKLTDYAPDQEMAVEVVDYDSSTGRIRLKIADSK